MVEVTPDGKHAVLGSEDRTLTVWDLESGEETALFTVESSLQACAFAPDGLTFLAALGCRVHVLRLEEFTPGTPIITSRRYRSGRLSVRCPRCADCFDIDRSDLGSEVACPNCDTELQVNPFTVDAPETRPATTALTREEIGGRPEKATEPRQLTGHRDRVSAIALTPDGRRVISGSHDDTIKVWDLESGKELRTWHSRAHVDALALTADGQRVVSIAEGTNIALIRVWDLARGELLRTLKGNHPVRKAALTPDGRRAFIAQEGKVRLWDVDENKDVCVIRGDTGEVSAVAIAPDGWKTLLGSEGGTLRVWDLERRKQLLRVVIGRGPIRAAAWTADASWAICATEDGRIRVFDVAHKKQLHTLTGHTAAVTALVLARDGRRLISASHDGTIRAWSMATGISVAMVRKECSFSACAAASDGLTVVAGDTAGRVHIIPLAGADPVP